MQIYLPAGLPHCRPTPLQPEFEKCHTGLQVKSTRKGLTNQLKTLLWRKPSTGGSAVSIHGRESPLSGSTHGGSVHGGSANGGLMANSGGSMDSQMRSLADLAFLMQVGACAANSVPNGNAHNIPTFNRGPHFALAHWMSCNARACAEHAC